MKNHIVIIGLSFLIFFVGCKTIDTCNDTLGKTFQDIAVKRIIKDPDNSNIVLQLEVTALDTLPDVYFEEFKTLTNSKDPYGIAIDNSARYIREVAIEKTNILITLSEELLQEENSADLHFLFQFKDRRQFIGCTHPGGADKYLLVLRGNLVGDSSPQLALTSFSWEEDFIPGSY